MIRAAVAMLALACASTTGGGVRATETPERARLTTTRAVAAAPATLTIFGHAPTHKQGGACGTVDSTRAARCSAIVLYQIGHRHPLYQRGDEFDAALWARDAAYGAPIQVASVGVTEGAAFAFTVADTLEYMVKVRWAEYGPGSREHETNCWTVIRR